MVGFGDEIIRIRDARNSELLPDKLRDMKLVGSSGGVLYLGSECGDTALSDTLILGYSIKDNSIVGSVKLEEGSWAKSWAQRDNLLFVGTRGGTIVSINMDNCEEVGRLKNFENSIDSVALNNDIYFGVNGNGIHRENMDLTQLLIRKKKKQVVSALAFRDNRLFAFYYSNGNDPALCEGFAGGLVEVLDRNLKVLSTKSGTPYAVTQAMNTAKRLMFSTGDISNGWSKTGEGALYSLNPSDLSYEHISELPAAVNILKQGLGSSVLVGLKNGQVYQIGNKERIKIHSQEYEVTGLEIQNGYIFVGSPNGEIHKVSF